MMKRLSRVCERIALPINPVSFITRSRANLRLRPRVALIWQRSFTERVDLQALKSYLVLGVAIVVSIITAAGLLFLPSDYRIVAFVPLAIFFVVLGWRKEVSNTGRMFIWLAFAVTFVAVGGFFSIAGTQHSEQETGILLGALVTLGLIYVAALYFDLAWSTYRKKKAEGSGDTASNIATPVAERYLP